MKYMAIAVVVAVLVVAATLIYLDRQEACEPKLVHGTANEGTPLEQPVTYWDKPPGC
jgi:hypothetical protein